MGLIQPHCCFVVNVNLNLIILMRQRNSRQNHACSVRRFILNNLLLRAALYLNQDVLSYSVLIIISLSYINPYSEIHYGAKYSSA